MIVKSAAGDVDLSRPENIRRGMVFRSNESGDVTITEPYEGNLWRVKGWPENEFTPPAFAHWAAFLGCDPKHAARTDCERFGLAPLVDAGAHGFARTRDGFAVDMRRPSALRGAVIQAPGTARLTLTHRQPFVLAEGQRLVGLDMRHASAEDVERLCCGERETADRFDPATGTYLPASWRRCTLAIGDHAEHEDIAAGAKWAAKTEQASVSFESLRAAMREDAVMFEDPRDQHAYEASKASKALERAFVYPHDPHTFGAGTRALAYTVNGKTETVRYERETTTAKLQKALAALLAADPHASAMVARRSAIPTEYTPADDVRDLQEWRAARETTMKLRHGEATDKGDHFWYIGTCGAAVTSETIPEIVRLATERGKPVKADVNGVAVTAYPGCHVEGLAQAWLAALDGKADVVASTWWTDVNFLCPECASINQWGSSRQADGTLRRHCHGHLVQPDGSGKACRFSWPEAEDAGRLKNRERGGDYLVIGGGAPPTSPVYAVDSPEDAARIFGKGSEMAGKARESLVSTWVDAPIWPTSHTLTIRAADIPASIVNLTPQAAALRAALSTVDTLQWSAADKRALRDAAHAVCEMIEATDGKAPAGLRGPVTEALAALASAAHVGPAIIGEAVKARDAARVVMARRK